ncbi:MAG: thiamine diphosphokinase [Anaerolineae bacterium]|nr:thiamine diphosphokinase [Anaerolineae bacterium]
MTQRAIILANGEIVDIPTLKTRLAGWEGVPVIAANGGCRYAARLGLRLDAVVGDLDSLDPVLRATLSTAGTRLEVRPAHKDETDLELALLDTVRHGADYIVVLGALGGRLDMTLANTLLLLHPQLARVRVELWNGSQTAWLICPPGDDLIGAPDDTLSLIPLSGNAEGITTQGLAYPLNDETLEIGKARGISNVFTQNRAHISLRLGSLMVVHTPGRA